MAGSSIAFARFLRAGVVLVALAAAACAQAPAVEAPAPEAAGSHSGPTAAPESLVRLADATHAAGDAASAASLYHRAALAAPQDVAVQIRLGFILHGLGALAEADAAFRRALAVEPQNPDALRGLGITLIARDMPRHAVEQLEAAVAARADARAFNALGVARDMTGSRAAAQAAYRAGLEADADNPTILNNLGLSLALSGDHGEAIAVLERAIAAPGATPRHRQNLALAYGLAGRPDKAAEVSHADLDMRAVRNNLGVYAWLRAEGGGAGTVDAAIAEAADGAIAMAAARPLAPATAAAAPLVIAPLAGASGQTAVLPADGPLWEFDAEASDPAPGDEPAAAAGQAGQPAGQPADEAAAEDGTDETADGAAAEDGTDEAADEAAAEDGTNEAADEAAAEDGTDEAADEAAAEDEATEASQEAGVPEIVDDEDEGSANLSIGAEPQTDSEAHIEAPGEAAHESATDTTASETGDEAASAPEADDAAPFDALAAANGAGDLPPQLAMVGPAPSAGAGTKRAPDLATTTERAALGTGDMRATNRAAATRNGRADDAGSPSTTLVDAAEPVRERSLAIAQLAPGGAATAPAGGVFAGAAAPPGAPPVFDRLFELRSRAGEMADSRVVGSLLGHLALFPPFGALLAGSAEAGAVPAMPGAADEPAQVAASALAIPVSGATRPLIYGGAALFGVALALIFLAIGRRQDESPPPA